MIELELRLESELGKTVVDEGEDGDDATMEGTGDGWRAGIIANCRCTRAGAGSLVTDGAALVGALLRAFTGVTSDSEDELLESLELEEERARDFWEFVFGFAFFLGVPLACRFALGLAWTTGTCAAAAVTAETGGFRFLFLAAPDGPIGITTAGMGAVALS